MKKTIAAFTAAVLLLSVLAVLAETEAGKVFRNKIETVFVQVDVQQLRETEKGLRQIQDGIAVMPGEKISYIPRVKVTGVRSYVRMRFDAVMNEAGGVEITPDDIYGLNKSWIKRGAYFYCTKVMSSGESSDVFRGIKVPQIDSGVPCSGFRISITADAVQQDHFAPDFSRSAPWGSISIQRSFVDGNVKKRVAASAKKDELDLRNDDIIECSTDDLFEGFAGMAAGDSRSDRLILRNVSDDTREVYFQTSNHHAELLKQVELRLQCAETFAYNGDLESEKFTEPVKIATLDPGEKTVFNYTIELPNSSDNRFQDMADSVVWMFDSKAVKHAALEKNVRTEDDQRNAFIAAVMLCMCAAGALLLLLRKHRNGNKEMRR